MEGHHKVNRFFTFQFETDRLKVYKTGTASPLSQAPTEYHHDSFM